MPGMRATATITTVAAHVSEVEVWTASEVGAYLGVTARTVRSYASRRQPRSDPIPEPVAMIGVTPVWDPAEIRAWHARRPGKGWRGRKDYGR